MNKFDQLVEDLSNGTLTLTLVQIAKNRKPQETREQKLNDLKLRSVEKLAKRRKKIAGDLTRKRTPSRHKEKYIK